MNWQINAVALTYLCCKTYLFWTCMDISLWVSTQAFTSWSVIPLGYIMATRWRTLSPTLIKCALEYYILCQKPTYTQLMYADDNSMSAKNGKGHKPIQFLITDLNRHGCILMTISIDSFTPWNTLLSIFSPQTGGWKMKRQNTRVKGWLCSAQKMNKQSLYIVQYIHFTQINNSKDKKGAYIHISDMWTPNYYSKSSVQSCACPFEFQ